ncbi:MAG: PAS domain-containing protein, partial [Bdellovibrionales bacterium]|nr:PAS domain-containing protein [Bdellovibrionales bacterium]
IDELFFSTTDPKGIILSGNNVFCRVSDYKFEEMYHKAHSLIRHPDMPRAVFKLLWDYLKLGKPIAAYVKNLAADGKYYWVLALVAPLKEGYLSVRFKPSSDIFRNVEKIYKELREIENKTGDRGNDRKLGMARSTERLLKILKDLGFDCYDSFMHTAIREEMKSRDSLLAKNHTTIVKEVQKNLLNLIENHPSAEVLKHIFNVYKNSYEAYSIINSLYDNIDDFINLNETLTEKSGYVLGLTTKFQLLSINTAIEASKLGTDGLSLGVIANHLGTSSKSMEIVVSNFTHQIEEIVETLKSVIFNLAGSRLQSEMILVFCNELLENAFIDGQARKISDIETLEQNLLNLNFVLAQTILTTAKQLNFLTSRLSNFDLTSEELSKLVTTLRFSQLRGTMEATSVNASQNFSGLFESVREQIDEAQVQLRDLSNSLKKIFLQLKLTPAMINTIDVSIKKSTKEAGEISIH